MFELHSQSPNLLGWSKTYEENIGIAKLEFCILIVISGGLNFVL